MTRTEVARRWLAHVDAQPHSGLSQRAYCETHGVSVKSFGYWRRKHRRVLSRVSASPPRLIPMRVIDEPVADGSSSSGVRLHAGRLVIDLSPQFDAATLQRVLGVLQC